MALGLYSNRTTRLNIYIYSPDKTPKAFLAEVWGGGLLSHRACIVAKDRASQQIKIIGQIIPKHLLPQDKDKVCTRVKVVEEGLTFGDRHEFRFYVEDITVEDKAIVRQRPYMEPASLMRHHARQD
jgi:hypothetical protein